ncbi:MAG TPA: Rieske 2Fe-2S domain-containing protein [Stellaceae bacterium]|nr:Rieske 2Fe-2S domain-containing protein [Stellaceae bacterium]
MTDGNVGALVLADRIHGRLYYDPEIFAQEQRRIWNRVWVYLGHESEIPARGDYVRRQLGLQPVIMVRGDDNAIRVLYNRCRHRANLVCHKDRGNAAELTCPYHGWTYARDGRLVAPTFGEAYEASLRQEDFGLTPVARVAAYRGFVFASATASGIGLDEHLGHVKPLIDFSIDRAPAGELELSAGTQCVRYRGNWKMMAENSVENYHGPVVHKVAFALSDRRAGRVRASITKRLRDQEDETLSFTGGHMAEYLPRQGSPTVKREPSPARRAYLDAMIATYGEARARELTETLPSFFFVFPNLLFIQTHLRRIEPVSVDETNVYYQPALLKGAPTEINDELLRFHETSFGPAGFVAPDDMQIMERNQAALRATGDEWLFLGRGIHREHHLADGTVSGQFMDETQLRGLWRHYAHLMATP